MENLAMHHIFLSEVVEDLPYALSVQMHIDNEYVQCMNQFEVFQLVLYEPWQQLSIQQ